MGIGPLVGVGLADAFWVGSRAGVEVGIAHRGLLLEKTPSSPNFSGVRRIGQIQTAGPQVASPAASAISAGRLGKHPRFDVFYHRDRHNDILRAAPVHVEQVLHTPASPVS
jgi:hypothetical protein